LPRDYFRPVESGEMDVVAFQVVTVGERADARIAELNARGEFSPRRTSSTG